MKTLLLSLFTTALLISNAFADSYKVDEIKVYKSENRMVMLYKGKITKEYEVMLGRGGEGPKVQEGDNLVPEGSYKLTVKNPKSLYYKSIRINYPNKQDIKKAKELGVDPGGDIYIHGTPNSQFGSWVFGNWTRGCVAVTNDEMDEIWDNVQVPTPITIYP